MDRARHGLEWQREWRAARVNEAEWLRSPITFDKNLSYQQNFQRYDLPVLILDAEDNTYDRLALLMPTVLKAIDDGLGPGPMKIA